jgi:hypothetical protein
MPVIFPLREKLFTGAVFLQQRPRWTGWRKVTVLPTLPWDDADRPPVIGYGLVELPPIAANTLPINYGLSALQVPTIQLSAVKQPPYPAPYSEQRYEPAVVHALQPLPAVFCTVSGRTLDSAGAVLGNCVAQLFDTATDAFLGEVISNADGYYYLRTTNQTRTHYVVAYKAGGTDVAGTTLNTLLGVCRG